MVRRDSGWGCGRYVRTVDPAPFAQEVTPFDKVSAKWLWTQKPRRPKSRLRLEVMCLWRTMDVHLLLPSAGHELVPASREQVTEHLGTILRLFFPIPNGPAEAWPTAFQVPLFSAVYPKVLHVSLSSYKSSGMLGCSGQTTNVWAFSESFFFFFFLRSSLACASL